MNANKRIGGRDFIITRHSLLAIIDKAVSYSPDEQATFDDDMQKPLPERSHWFHYPDDPNNLVARASSLMREAADLSEEARKLLQEAGARTENSTRAW